MAQQATQVTTEPACSCGYTGTPVQLGQHLSGDCDGELVEEQPTVTDTTETVMTDSETEVSVREYAQLASYEYSANVQIDDEDVKTVVVDLFNGDVTPIGPGAKGVTDSEKRELLREMVGIVPDTFEQPMTMIRNDHQISTADSAGGGATSADTSGEDDSFDGEIVADPGSTDYDGEELEQQVDEWLNNYASVKSSMLEGAWSLEFGRITDPDSGESELGVHIDVAPWYAGPDVWDSGDREWADSDASDTFGDHREAMRSIFTDDDSPVEGVAEDNGDDYPDWYNYVPADDVSEL